MDELGYEQALDLGIEPIHYRGDRLQELELGQHEGVLDALVWAKRQPALQALITLDNGVKILVIGFQRHTRKELSFPRASGSPALCVERLIALEPAPSEDPM